MQLCNQTGEIIIYRHQILPACLSLLFFLLIPTYKATSQPCSNSSTLILGEDDHDENAHCLVSSALSSSIYVAGNQDNATLLIKMTDEAEVEWAMTFDIIPNDEEYPAGIIEDSDGMIVVCGTGRSFLQGGSVYAFKFNPFSQTIIWSKEYQQSPNDYSFGMIEKGPGGNYLLHGQATHFAQNHNYAEVFEIERSTGNPNNEFSKNYQIIGTETLFELMYYAGRVFGVGRYKDGGLTLQMRNTLTEIDPVNGDQIWVRMGHQPKDEGGRLYGTDLIIENNTIYSIYQGDPVGASTTSTKTYLQRTDLHGDLQWIKTYECPGNNDVALDIMSVSDGIILLFGSFDRNVHYLIKTDWDGIVIWAREYALPDLQPSTRMSRGNTQLVKTDSHLFFCTTALGSNGKGDITIIQTDLEGNTIGPCIENNEISIAAVSLADYTWYEKTVIEFDVFHNTYNRPVNAVIQELPKDDVCISRDTFFEEVFMELCEGEAYESYTQSGVYQDMFLTEDGCDSIRTLELHFNPVVMTDYTVTICEGMQYEGHISSGIYPDTLTSSIGCDSISTLHLEVVPTIYTTVVMTLCQGEQYEGYFVSGIYTDTLQSSAGCDSIRELQLEVFPVAEMTIAATICFGESYEGYSSTGTFVDTFTNIHGCDSIRILQLEVLPLISGQIAATVCEGQLFEGYSTSGEYVDTLTGVNGCDSIRTLSLLFADEIVSEERIVLCFGDVYEGYTQSGIYVDTFQSVFGCDSISMLVIEVLPENSMQVFTTRCDEQYMQFPHAGIFQDTLKDIHGCDSIVTIQVDDLSLYVPNVFSPNQDQINDEFYVSGNGDIADRFVSLEIFDRTGGLIFLSSVWPAKWDGRDRKGRWCNPGVFTYVLTYACGIDQLHTGGNITLLR